MSMQFDRKGKEFENLKIVSMIPVANIVCNIKVDCFVKYTVFRWKYTRHHIGQPAPTIPVFEEERPNPLSLSFFPTTRFK